jgi:processive 1,2-diacylglycerol beta-glucosyltransferase
MPEIIEACYQLSSPLQIVVVCGKNKKLYQRLKALPLRQHHLVVLGFVENIHELMKVADVLISKPGGMTVAESLCCQLPLIIYRPIPGQEEANTAFLEGYNVAMRASSAQDIPLLLHSLFTEEAVRLSELRAEARKLSCPEAAGEIASAIF